MRESAIMRIASGSIVFICFVNLAGGRRELDNVETKVVGDPEWWSERITKTDREETETIGLARKDNERNAPGWEEETGDPRRRPRPFASSTERPETRSVDSHFESRRENSENGRGAGRLLDSERPPPSPVLQPPYASSSSVHFDDSFDDHLVPPWNNESSSGAGKFTDTAPDRTGINEIAKFNYSNDVRVESEPRYGDDDDSSGTMNTANDDRWIDFLRESSVNFTKSSDRKSIGEAEPGIPRSFYIDEELGNKRPESSRVASGRSNRPKNSRGNVKYTDDRFESVKTFMRKRTFSSPGRYDRQRRPSQRSNHFRFSDDSSGKTGAVPGVPGRDYPVHQEHTHHHLRNVVDRFPCPRASKNHVYLADRASRCQIFYVCYGTNTGVPMVCPNGTLFSEPLQVCDWWFNVAC